jgi:hypothetical protein
MRNAALLGTRLVVGSYLDSRGGFELPLTNLADPPTSPAGR